ncbi:MAG: hypothetical protein ACK40G_13980 [Cytophagaceae bacterium]
MNKHIYFSLLLFLLVVTASHAQNNYYINGLGRTIITRDNLSGPVLEGDNSTPRRGVGGYLLFDLGNNLDVSNDFKANAILRLRSPYGAFWGVGTEFQIRQFQISGKIRRNIEFQLGDINVGQGMSLFTVNNFATEYHKYESEVFRSRREILEYENFIFSNMWRLQGFHTRGGFTFENLPLNKLGIYAFATRTNATNEVDVPDRILAGGNITAEVNDQIQVGANYAGLVDVPIQQAAVNYKNNVFTGIASYNLNKGSYSLKLKGEGGYSDFNYSTDSASAGASFNDYFYNLDANLGFAPLKMIISGAFRDVGPNFTSPAAQTRRIDVTRTPMLFPAFGNNSLDRNQTLYDRFTGENLYRRSISPVLMPFLPWYNNISPYGIATPNRRGFSIGIASDTSLKVIQADLEADILSEIIGEGVKDKRKFLGIRGGAIFKINQVLGMNKLLFLSAGARYESTGRQGLAPINFSSTLFDLGVTYELLSNFDLLAGTKILLASGNEFISTRNEFNQITNIDAVNVNLSETIYSAGFRLRMSSKAAFYTMYNFSSYNRKSPSDLNYGINQLFVNFTLKF